MTSEKTAPPPTIAHEIFEEALARVQQILPPFDWKGLPGLATPAQTSEYRAASVAAGISERVNLAAVARRFFKTRGMTYDPSLDLAYGDMLGFRRPLSADLDFFVTLYKTSGYGLGKMFEVIFGIHKTDPSIQTPAGGGRLQLLFGQNDRGWMWGYTTREELERALAGIGRLLDVVEPLMFPLFLDPPPRPYRESFAPQEAFDEAKLLALTWAPDVRCFRASARPKESEENADQPATVWTFTFYSAQRSAQIDVVMPRSGTPMFREETPVNTKYFSPRWLE